MSQIGKRQAYGVNNVPEINGYYPEWEWPYALETFGAHSLSYKEEYLRDDVSYAGIQFYNKRNDILVSSTIILSKRDKVKMKMNMHYNYDKKELIYDPICIIQEEPDNGEEDGQYTWYEDEESINEYLNENANPPAMLGRIE